LVHPFIRKYGWSEGDPERVGTRRVALRNVGLWSGQ
jgi:hypothetical protein